MRYLLVGGNTVDMLSLLLYIFIIFILLKYYKLLHLSTTNSNSDFSIYRDIDKLTYSYFTNLLQLSFYSIYYLLFAVGIGRLYITQYA